MIDPLLDRIGWTRAECARRLGVNKSTVDVWANQHRADQRIVTWLEWLALHHDAAPMPPGWTPRGPGRPKKVLSDTVGRPTQGDGSDAL